MKSKRLGGDGTRHVLVFDKGDEVVEQLLAFAEQEQVTAASFSGIGAFSDVTLGFFERKDYKRIPLAEQVEVLTLAGDIAVKDGEPQVHAHVVVGKADGTAWADISSRATSGRRSSSSSSSRRTSGDARSMRRRVCH